MFSHPQKNHSLFSRVLNLESRFIHVLNLSVRLQENVVRYKLGD